MNQTSAEIDYLIDRFVDVVNTGSREPVDPDDTPPSVLVGEPNEYDNYNWRIKPLASIDWVEPLEKRLGFRIPAVYRSLIARYIFPAFEFGDIFFFANTPEGTAFFEFRDRLFADPRCPQSCWTAAMFNSAVRGCITTNPSASI